MREVTPLTAYQLFKGNMLSRYNWDIESSGSFDPEAPKLAFVVKRSYAQVAAQKMGEAFKSAVIKYTRSGNGHG